MALLSLSFKGKPLGEYPLENGDITIGRDPGCDIPIDSLAVEPVHIRISLTPQNATLEDVAHTDKVFVNHKVVRRHSLAFNDIIRIGKHTFTYLDNSEDILTDSASQEKKNAIIANSTGAPLGNSHSFEHNIPKKKLADNSPSVPEQKVVPISQGWLQLINGSEAGKTFKLRSGITKLDKMGMPPAVIVLRKSGYYISSLSDEVDIQVGTENIEGKSYPLNDGEMIRIGKTEVLFHLQPN